MAWDNPDVEDTGFLLVHDLSIYSCCIHTHIHTYSRNGGSGSPPLFPIQMETENRKDKKVTQCSICNTFYMCAFLKSMINQLLYKGGVTKIFAFFFHLQHQRYIQISNQSADRNFVRLSFSIWIKSKRERKRKVGHFLNTLS